MCTDSFIESRNTVLHIFISSVGDFLCVSVFLCTCQQRGSHVQVVNKPKLGVYAFILKGYWRDLRALLPWIASFCFWSRGGCLCVAIMCTFIIVLLRPFLSSGKFSAGNKTQWAVKGWSGNHQGWARDFTLSDSQRHLYLNFCLHSVDEYCKLISCPTHAKIFYEWYHLRPSKQQNETKPK